MYLLLRGPNRKISVFPATEDSLFCWNQDNFTTLIQLEQQTNVWRLPTINYAIVFPASKVEKWLLIVTKLFLKGHF